ncbi:MAG: hypothetical protein ACRDKS_04560 [Actinomycetota bacterium]
MKRVGAGMALILTLLSACGGPSVGSRGSGAGPVPRIDQIQRNTTATWGYDPAVNATWLIAQTFTIPREGSAIRAVTLWVESARGSGISLQIHTPTSAADPLGTMVSAIELDPQQIQSNRQLRVNFSPSAAVTPGAVYSLVVVPQGDASISLGLQNTNPYSGGRGYSFDPQPGRGWRPEDFDLAFEIEFDS